jgi:spore maturation protein CgeB
MRFVYFTHSLLSCWNHGNAHFLRGVFRELTARGHETHVFEPAGNWSLENLLRDHGEAGLEPFRSGYPELVSASYGADLDLDRALDGADVVIVHEWNEHALVAAIGAHRRRGGRYTLLFHDTHHRAVSDPQAMQAYDLSGYDGVLAFGETLSDVYRAWGWGERVFTWHEAADTRLFKPPARESEREGLVWIGNWGDDERSEELESYLFRPAAELGLSLDVYGVRYPDAALATLSRHGASYLGWLPNARAPEIFARHLATVHVPRRLYVQQLPGIPTIRVFEALAVRDPARLGALARRREPVRVGTDFLMARDQTEMTGYLRAVRDDG